MRTKTMLAVFCSICAILFSNYSFAAGKINRVKKAEEFMIAKMSSQAETLLWQEVNENPTNAKAHLLLGVINLSKGNNWEADQRFQAAINYNAGFSSAVAEDYVVHATMNFDRNDLDKTNGFLNKAVAYNHGYRKIIAQRLYKATKYDNGELQGNMLLLALTFNDDPNSKREMAQNYIKFAKNANNNEKAMNLLETGLKFAGDESFKKELLNLYVAVVNDESYKEDFREKYRQKVKELGGEKLYASLLPNYKEVGFGELHVSCKAGEYTHEWIVFPDNAHCNFSSPDYNYYIVLPDGREFKDGPNVTLPGKIKKVKLKAITDQPDITIKITAN